MRNHFVHKPINTIFWRTYPLGIRCADNNRPRQKVASFFRAIVSKFAATTDDST